MIHTETAGYISIKKLKMLEDSSLAKKCWEKLGNVTVDEDDNIDIDFEFNGTKFEKGTDKFEIWHWIEETFNYPIHKLMYE